MTNNSKTYSLRLFIRNSNKRHIIHLSLQSRPIKSYLFYFILIASNLIKKKLILIIKILIHSWAQVSLEMPNTKNSACHLPSINCKINLLSMLLLITPLTSLNLWATSISIFKILEMLYFPNNSNWSQELLKSSNLKYFLPLLSSKTLKKLL